MLVVKENKVFYKIVFILVIVIEECYACFSENQNQTIPIKAGSSFYRLCHCTDDNYAIGKLKWLDINGQEISTYRLDTMPNVYTEQRNNGISLHISNVSKTISGFYKCVTNQNGRTYSLIYKIDAYEPLYFINADADQFAIKGTDSLIRCEARSETGPNINWHKGKDETMITSDEKYKITPEGLIIYNVSDEDKGIYKCTAVDYETGDDDDRFIKVDVMTLPVIKELRVQDDTDNLSFGQTVVVGEFLSIECIAEGVPSPEYFWNKISTMNSTDDKNITWHQEYNVIVFDSIAADDEGTYECIAINKAGEDRKQIFIEVLIPPSIDKFDNITITEGSNAELICAASGKPNPVVNIISTDKNVTETITIHKENKKENGNEYKLTFPNINRKHRGFYNCSANNDVDEVTEEAYVNVLYKPYFENPIEHIWGWNGITVNLSCEHDSNPPSEINWSYQSNKITTEEQIEVNKRILSVLNSNPAPYVPLNVDRKFLFGNYHCTAKNDFGEATKSIILQEAFTPPAVRAVTVDNLTAKSATFFINGPEKVEGPPILGFQSEYDVKQNYDITNIHINRTWSIDRPYRLDKLKPNTTYSVRFAAVNKVGVGVWSEYMEFNTPERSAPDAPSWEDKIYIAETDSGMEKLKWNAPDDNGDPIDYYILRYCQVLTGHGGFSQYLYRFKSRENPSCYCEPGLNKLYFICFWSARNLEQGIRDKLVQENMKEYMKDDIKREKFLGYNQEIAKQEQEGVIQNDLCEEKQIPPTTELLLDFLESNTTYFVELLAHNSEGNSTIVNTYINTSAWKQTWLSAGARIGIAIVIVLISIALLDLLLFCWRRQGIMATCCFNKNKKNKENNILTRDRKGLLKDNGNAADDTLKRTNNGHKEYQYNKSTGTITGKHSAV